MASKKEKTKKYGSKISLPILAELEAKEIMLSGPINHYLLQTTRMTTYEFRTSGAKSRFISPHK